MSNNSIKAEDVAYVAKLARVALSDEETERFRGQLESILGYVAKLQSVKTDGVAPTAHPHDVANVWREDEAKPFPNRKGLFANAPEMEETFYRVKKVIE